MISYGCSKKIDVSVIVPLYKGKKYIDNIKDMIKKNCLIADKIQVELIFVNDYPDDKIGISQFDTTEFDTFFISNKKNYGIQRARIEGLKQARGKYILFLDQDDKIADNYLLKQLSVIGKADAVVCNGIREESQVKAKIFPDDNRPQLLPQKFLQKSNQIVSPGQVVIRKTSIPRQWIENIIPTSGTDDYYLWILMMLQNAIFEYNEKVVYTHVEHRENFSKNHVLMRNSLIEMYKLIKEKNRESNNIFYAELGIKRAIKCEENYIKLSILSKNDAIKKFFTKEKIMRFAIYGYGRQGRTLIQTLQTLNLSPACIVEERKDILNCPYNLCDPESDLKNIDLLIITPVSYYEEIKKQYVNSGIRIILSMEEFLTQCINTQQTNAIPI